MRGQPARIQGPITHYGNRATGTMRSVGADSAAMRTPIPIVDRLRNAPKSDVKETLPNSVQQYPFRQWIAFKNPSRYQHRETG